MAIELFYLPEDSWSKKAQELLKSLNVDFVARDLSDEKQARKDLVRRSAKITVPTLIVGETVIIGFDEAQIRAAVTQ